jgi:hypothetical protein
MCNFQGSARGHAGAEEGYSGAESLHSGAKGKQSGAEGGQKGQRVYVRYHLYMCSFFSNVKKPASRLGDDLFYIVNLTIPKNPKFA